MNRSREAQTRPAAAGCNPILTLGGRVRPSQTADANAVEKPQPSVS